MDTDFQDELTPYLQGMDGRMQRVSEVMARAVVGLFVERYRQFDRTRPNALGGTRTHFWGAVAKSVHAANITPQGFDVDVTHVGVRLRWLGGTVTPGKGISCKTGRPTRMLTIPVDAEAHGRRACEYDNLTPLWGRHGPWALAIAPDAAARRQIALKKSKEVKARTTAKSTGARLLWKPVLGSKSPTYGEEMTITKGGRGKERLGEFQRAHRILFLLVRSTTHPPDDSVVPEEDEIADVAVDAAQAYLIGGAARRAARHEEGGN